MPLDGLGLGHESDSVHSDMLKSHVLGRPGGSPNSSKAFTHIAARSSPIVQESQAQLFCVASTQVVVTAKVETEDGRIINI